MGSNEGQSVKVSFNDTSGMNMKKTGLNPNRQWWHNSICRNNQLQISWHVCPCLYIPPMLMPGPPFKNPYSECWLWLMRHYWHASRFSDFSNMECALGFHGLYLWNNSPSQCWNVNWNYWLPKPWRNGLVWPDPPTTPSSSFLTGLYKKLQAMKMAQLLTSRDHGVRKAADLRLSEEKKSQIMKFIPAALIDTILCKRSFPEP